MSLQTRLTLTALACFLLPASAAAQAGSFKFDFEVGTSALLTWPQGGLIPLRLIYEKGKSPDADNTLPRQVLVSPSPFISDAGSVVPRLSRGKCDSKRLPTALVAEFALAGEVQELCLFFADLPVGKYAGNILVDSEKTDAVTKALAVQRAAAPAAPAAVQTTFVVSGRDKIESTIPFTGCPATSCTEQFSATIQEKSGKAPIEGLYARMEVVKSPSGYDLKDVGFLLDGKVADLSRIGSSDKARTISAGGQGRVDVTLKNLTAGEYNLVFRFAGTNTGTDDSQKLAVPVHVRHHWLWAVALLLVASLVSFVATKVVAGKRRRFDLLQKIGSLRPAWLGTFRPTSPVVWVRAMLSQAETLSSRFWLTSPDVIEERVNQVRNVLKVLDLTRSLQQRLSGRLNFLVSRKVLPDLERTINRIGAGPLDDAGMSKVEAELEAFEGWLDPTKSVKLLWDGIQQKLRDLVSNITENSAQIPTSPLFARLQTAVETALKTPPTDQAGAEAAYDAFARLNILWEVRNDPATFAACSSAASDLERFFNTADLATWNRLKGKQLDIQLPVSSEPGGIEAFAPLQFMVTSSQLENGERYLLNYRIQYRWTFKWKPPARWFLPKSSKVLTLTPVTYGPSVMQYFTLPGEVVVEVEMDFLGATHRVVQGTPLAIRPSREFRLMRGFESAEILSWAIALLIAIASGLSIYYVGAPGWGSFKDYLTLFLWGAGMEQGKTFLQSAVK